jgi:hypothetical protein
VSKRVSPTARLRADIDELFSSDRELSSILEDVARLSVRLMMQVAVEAEVDEFLGRVRYERRDDDDRPGSRNGWQPPATVKTTMGPVELQRPKLRGTDEAFCSRLFGAGVTRTNALESLVISGWVRGLSERDIEAALAEVLGPEAALSKSTVSRICQRIRTEFDAWKTRGLSEVRLDYLFVDGSHFKMHPGAPAEPVLAAWGIDTDGKPVLVGLAPASSESTDAWDDFLADLVARGLRAPVAGHQRRRPRAVWRLRPNVPHQPAPALPDPPRPHSVIVGGLSLLLSACWPAPGIDAGRTGHNPFEDRISRDTVDDLHQIGTAVTDGGDVAGRPRSRWCRTRQCTSAQVGRCTPSASRQARGCGRRSPTPQARWASWARRWRMVTGCWWATAFPIWAATG